MVSSNFAVGVLRERDDFSEGQWNSVQADSARRTMLDSDSIERRWSLLNTKKIGRVRRSVVRRFAKDVPVDSTE